MNTTLSGEAARARIAALVEPWIAERRAKGERVGDVLRHPAYGRIPVDALQAMPELGALRDTLLREAGAMTDRAGTAVWSRRTVAVVLLLAAMLFGGSLAAQQVALTPDSLTLAVGDTSRVVATVRGATGQRISYRGTNAAAFTTHRDGRVTARAVGCGYVRAGIVDSTWSRAQVRVCVTAQPAPPPVDTVVPPPPVAGDAFTFGNLPSTLFTRTDARWTEGMAAGWGLAQRTASIGIAPDPRSPTGQSLRMLYPAGFPDAQEAGVAYWGGGAVADHREMFLGVTMRYSDNWVQHQNQVKLHLWNMDGIAWFGIFDGCWQDRPGWWSMAVWGREVIPWTPTQGDCWINNLRPVAAQYARGQWVKHELYARKSDAGQANGIIRLWVDGVLVLEATNLVYPSGFRWSEFQHAGTWGGGGSAVPATQSIHFARTLIATR